MVCSIEPSTPEPAMVRGEGFSKLEPPLKED